MLKNFPGGIVFGIAAYQDTRIVPIRGINFSLTIVGKHLGDISSDVHFLKLADYRNALEKYYSPDEHFRVFHFDLCTLLDRVMKFTISPLITHFGMHHVLADDC